MSTYVLVHGAFHGGWCWRRVADRLIAAGHRVFTPTLTGLGERAHLLTASVDLETHVRDVTGVLEAEELDEVILVGHSYGGIPVSAAADRLPARVAQLVLLDAVVLEDGESWSSIHPPAVVERFMSGAIEQYGGLAIPVPDVEAFGITDENDRRWVARRLTPHPFGTYRQPVKLRRPAGEGIDRVYIACTSKALLSLASMKARLHAGAGWQITELRAGHDAMISAPADVTRLLLGNSSDPERAESPEHGGAVHG